VQEEVRLKVENPPYAAALLSGMYDLYAGGDCFAYAHSPFGSMADLDAATVEDAREFFAAHYHPGNATLAIASNFDPGEARRLVEAYFGGIPSRIQLDAAPICESGAPPGGSRRSVYDPRATLPAVLHFYRVPAFDHADYPALVLLAEILGAGNSARLNQTLVREARIAAAAEAALNVLGPRRGPGVLQLNLIGIPGMALDSLDAALVRQIERVTAHGVTKAELERARSTIRAETIMQRQQPQILAAQVLATHLFLGDEAINARSRVDGVTAEDIGRVARRYLEPENGMVLLVSNQQNGGA
jgi:predicted Zn-dependent peptidase